MVSLFKLISQSCGFPLHEAAHFLEAKPDITKSWWLGRRKPPEAILQKLIDLSIRQDIFAQELLLNMSLLKGRKTNRIILKICGNDLQAQAIGWPSANDYRAVIRKLVEKMLPELAMHLILVTSNEETVKI